MKKLIIILSLLLSLSMGQDYSVNFEYMSGYAKSSESSNSIFEGVSSFTVEVWYKNPGVVNGPNSSLPGNSNLVTNYRRLDGGDPYNNFNLSMESSISALPGYITFLGTQSSVQLDDNKWHHIAAIYDNENGIAYLYIDGVLNDTDYTSDDFLSSSNNLYINNHAPFAGEYHMECKIAGMKVSNGMAYSANFIPAFPLQSDTNTLIVLDFSIGNGNLLEDLSLNDNDFTILGNFSWDGERPMLGCTDSFADNYDETANVDDGSCTDYPYNGDYSLQFDGVDDYVNLGSYNSYNLNHLTQSFSLNFDVKITEFTNVPDYIIGTPMYDANNNRGFRINANDNNISVHAGGNSTNVEVNSGEIEIDSWYNVTAVFDREADILSLIINGVQVGSVSLSAIGTINNIHDINIGAFYASSIDYFTDDQFFNGLVDNLSIWNTSLTESDVIEIMQDDYEAQDGLIGHWKFNAGEDNILYDYSGNSNHGTIYGAAWVENIYSCTDELACNHNPDANGDDNSCDYTCHDNGDYSLSFDGVDDYVEYGGNNLPIGNSDRTISCWVQPHVVDQYALFGYGNQDENTTFEIFFYDDNGTLRPSVHYAYGNSGYENGLEVNLNEWNHLVATYDGISSRIYVNGEISITDIQPLNTEKIFRHIGALNHGPSTDQYLDGMINGCAIWNNTLTDNEINSLYNNGNHIDLSSNYEDYLSSDNLVAHFKFNAGTGATLYDHSGNGNHGTIHGGETWVENTYGCKDPDACNYDPDVDFHDPALCDYATDLCGVCVNAGGDNSSCQGCTETDANNYNPDAIIDDGSCIFGYSNDFEGEVGIEWSNNSVFTTPDGLNKFLGKFGSQSINLSLSGFENSNTVNFHAELWIIDTWDGNNHNDHFTLKINGNTFLSETFSNCSYCNQSYPNGGSNLPQTGANQTGGYGYTDTWLAIYNLDYEFEQSSSDLIVDFIVNLNSGINDESWGLDNISISTQDMSSFGCTDPLTSNYNPEANYDDGSCEYNFDYEQSSSQAFYFMREAEIDGWPILAGDLIVAYKADENGWPTGDPVGGAVWPGETMEVVVMGDDGDDYTSEYLQPGDFPAFRIYSFSLNRIYDARVSDPLEPFANLNTQIIDKLEIAYDCMGILGGHANIDYCGDCVEGTSGGVWGQSDGDGDGVCDEDDNCVDTINPDQENCDNDELGDLCDDDDDNDGCLDDEEPEGAVCVASDDPDQDNIGNDCDICPYDPENDIDGDGVCCGDGDPFCYDNQDDIDGDGLGCNLEGEGIPIEDICCFDPQNDEDGDGLCCNTLENSPEDDTCCTDPLNDEDSDGVCGGIDGYDACPGGDDNYDTDGDGTPNDCDVDLDLQHAASLVSFHALPEDPSVSILFTDHECDFIDIISQGTVSNGGAATWDLANDQWIGSLVILDCELGYWLIMDEDNPCEYDLIGNGIDGNFCSAYDEIITYSFDQFANLISYPYSINQPVGDYICESGSINGIISQGIAASCNENGNLVGSLQDFVTGAGYWFKTDDTGTSFEYPIPDPSNLSRKIAKLPAVPIEYRYRQSTQQAFYFIEDIENIEIGDWILSFNGDEVIGARQWQGSIIDVPAMGSDGSDYTKGYIKAGVIPSFKILRGDELINLEGDIPAFENNQLYMVSSLKEVALPESFSLDRAYPNPFNPVTTLSFAIPVDSEVFLSVYNLQGREVVSLVNGNMEAGYHSVVWNADNHASGVYFVKMVAGEYVNTQKLMLVK